MTTRPCSTPPGSMLRELCSAPGRGLATVVHHLRSSLRRGLLKASTLTLALAGALAAPLPAQIVSHNFDDGTTQGWGPRGSVSVVSSTDVARSGTNSLRTTGRTSGWMGPALDLRTRVPVNATYQVSAWVRLVAGQPASDLKFTLERTSGGSTSYSQITPPQTTTDAAWVQLQGTLTLPAGENTVCTLYLESSDVTSAYYLDDFTITSLTAPGCPQPLDQTGILTDFESGTNQGWSSRGSAVLANVIGVAQEGARSLSVTGRTASWQGPSINTLCKLHKGSKYRISVWLRLLPGEPMSDFRVSLQASLAGQVSYNTVIGNTPVTDAAWVNLTADYTFGLDVDQLSLYVETASGTASFYVDSFALVYLPPKPIQTDIPSLKTVLAPYFPLGTAVEPAELLGGSRDLLLKHFSQITAGNSMKWDATEPSDGVFNFNRADTLANFARQNGLRMRGHTLLWHSQTPVWVFQDANGNALQAGNPEHRALLLQRLRRHIHTIVPRYADIIDSWDVVNEVIDPSQPGGLRNSPWLQIIGPDYIDLAFRYAKEVSGNAALIINDYSTEDPAKRAALKTVVQGLLDRNVPVDGVGHQMHINVEWPSISNIRQTLQTFAAMGLMNEVTELDMSAYTNSTDTAPVPPETLVLQGFRYRDVFNVLREEAASINSVTFWGMSDDASWLKTFPITRPDKPLLFDEELQAKPAYWGVVDPLRLPIVPKELNVTRVSKWTMGVLDASWSSIATQPLTSLGTDGSWAKFRAGWKDGTVYLVAEVADTTRNTSDTLSVYVGGATYTFRTIGMQRPAGAEALGLPTRTGYTLFAAIPAGQTLALGSTIRFDVRATDGATGNRASWSDTKHNQDSDRTNLGTLTMTGEKKVTRAMRGTPSIDATEDVAWKKAETVQTKTFVSGTSGATAKVRTLWDDGHIYVYAEVTDPVLSKASPNVWEQDSVELFFDPNNAQSPVYDGDDAQYRINFDNERSTGGAASPSAITSATRKTATGYVVEAAIAVAGLPERVRLFGNAAFIGFDAQVNDDGAGNGVRSSVATWNDTTGSAYQDASQFGALLLVP